VDPGVDWGWGRSARGAEPEGVDGRGIVEN